jgi:transcription elongation factor Elf1
MSEYICQQHKEFLCPICEGKKIRACVLHGDYVGMCGECHKAENKEIAEVLEHLHEHHGG